MIATAVRELDKVGRKLQRQYENECNYPSPAVTRKGQPVLDESGETVTRRARQIERLEFKAQKLWEILKLETSLPETYTLFHQRDPRGVPLYVAEKEQEHGHRYATFG
jgi:hypothetical protein